MPQAWVGRVAPPWVLSVSAPAARHPGALVSNFPFSRRKSVQLLSLPLHQAAGWEIIESSVFPCGFSLLS